MRQRLPATYSCFRPLMAAAVLVACHAYLTPVAAAATTWNDVIAASNPLNWYRFEELSGETVFDSGSDALHGTLRNWRTDSPHRPVLGLTAPVGGAISFQQLGDHIWLDGDAIYGDWTVEFIVRVRDHTLSSSVLSGRWNPALANLVGRDSGDGALKLQQWYSTQSLGLTVYGVGDYLITEDGLPDSSGVEVPLNRFAHVAIVSTAAGSIAYLNGNAAGSTSVSIPLPRQIIGNETPFMVLDELIIYDRALTPEEIAAHRSAIPEPAAAWLLALAVTGLSHSGRRRRSATPNG